MQALSISRHGGPEVLNLLEQSAPDLFPEGVRIRVGAAGVNFADIMMRMGLYPEAPKAPFVPGYEIAGTVLEVAPEVTSFKPGDRVVGACQFGGYVSEIVLHKNQIRKTPSHLSDAEAASIPINYMTAWVALHEMARVRAGDKVFVPSAAGGVGVAAVQLAHLAGAYVVGAVGSPSKAAIVRELGANEVITSAQWEQGSDAEHSGYDIILDATGGASIKRAMRRLRSTGRIVSFGMSSLVGSEKRNIFRLIGEMLKTPIYTPLQLMMKNKGIFGLNMLQLFKSQPINKGNDFIRALDEVLKAFEEKKLRSIVGKEFPLDQGSAAHAYLQGRGGVGKVVLIPNHSSR